MSKIKNRLDSLSKHIAVDGVHERVQRAGDIRQQQTSHVAIDSDRACDVEAQRTVPGSIRKRLRRNLREKIVEVKWREAHVEENYADD